MTQPIHPQQAAEKPASLIISSSPSAAERLAIRTVHAAVLDGAHPSYSLTDQVVFTLGGAGLLADSTTVALVEHTVRALIADDIGRAVERNALVHPYESGMLVRRVGMRAAQRIVTEPMVEPLTLHFYRAARGTLLLGCYIVKSAAREHCEDDLRQRTPVMPAVQWSPSEDNPDVIEMATVERGHTSATAYTVTTVRVETTYDPEADA
jgi:hypothetical protein